MPSPWKGFRFGKSLEHLFSFTLSWSPHFGSPLPLCSSPISPSLSSFPPLFSPSHPLLHWLVLVQLFGSGRLETADSSRLCFPTPGPNPTDAMCDAVGQNRGRWEQDRQEGLWWRTRRRRRRRRRKRRRILLVVWIQLPGPDAAMSI